MAIDLPANAPGVKGHAAQQRDMEQCGQSGRQHE
jgi:hypothetical protein